jgi:dolichyl-phosphate-mannose-protein mannosyltransferase
MLSHQIKSVQYAIYGVLYATTIGLYILFMPICWGMVGPNRQYSYLKWFDNWRVTD